MNQPIWELFEDGTATPVAWQDHQPNPRFAIYSSGGATNPNDDLVWDKETGLIWPRNTNPKTNAMTWLDANTTCREFKLANRTGWRLPTVEELSSLIHTRNSTPALPTGHPFLSVQFGDGVWGYWTSTNQENPAVSAWFVHLGSGGAGLAGKGSNPTSLGFMWPVRGGRGGVSWNW
jgi:hypothetical protein